MLGFLAEKLNLRRTLNTQILFSLCLLIMTFSYGSLKEFEGLDFPLSYRSNSVDCLKVTAAWSATLAARAGVAGCPSGLSVTSSNRAADTVFPAPQFTVVQTAGTSRNQAGGSIVAICTPYLHLSSLSKFLKEFWRSQVPSRFLAASRKNKDYR